MLSMAVNLARGNRVHGSVIGIERCSFQEWALICIYAVLSCVLTAVAVKIVENEQQIKDKVGRSEDIRFDWPQLK